MIPYSRQTVTEEDIDEVVKVLRSDWLTQGPAVKQFEQSVADYCGVSYAVATCNATSALHIACLSLGIQSGDEVWVASISFVASANCARYCGASVNFVDVEPSTGLISLPDLARLLKIADKNGKLPKALVAVHLAGQSCAMQEIAQLCQHYNVRIIEDASHALGGKYQGKPIGNCEYSDLCVFSFHPVKPVATGEGGMLLTRSANIERKARLLASHGIERLPENWVHPRKSEWYYEQQFLGYNYRLSDIHAALGVSQMSRLDERIQSRAEIAQHYNAYFSTGAGTPLLRSDGCETSHHLYIVRFDSPLLRDNIFSRLRACGFGVNLHYMPIPEHPYYQTMGCDMANYPGAVEYASTAISLPLFQGMDIDVVKSVTAIVTQEIAKLN